MPPFICSWNRSTMNGGYIPPFGMFRRRDRAKTHGAKHCGGRGAAAFFLSFLGHQEIYPSDGGASIEASAPAHRLDEFPPGFSAAGWSPPLPPSASPAASEYAVNPPCRSITFKRTERCVLTICLSRGGKRTQSLVAQYVVTLAVTNPVQPIKTVISLSSTGLSFLYQSGWAAPLPQPQSFTVSADGLLLSVTTSGGNWLSATPTGGTPLTVTVSVNPVGLAPGEY